MLPRISLWEKLNADQRNALLKRPQVSQDILIRTRAAEIIKPGSPHEELPQNETFIYACGHPGMIESVREEVVDDGWNFIEERFWKE